MVAGKLHISVRDSRCNLHGWSKWDVFIYNCEGKLVKTGQTTNAYLQIEVPPGFYKIHATSSCDNWTTETTLVPVAEKDCRCVNLYSQSYWGCAMTFIPVLEVYGMIARVNVSDAIDVIRRTMEAVPERERLYLAAEQVDRMIESLEPRYSEAVNKHRDLLIGPRKRVA